MTVPPEFMEIGKIVAAQGIRGEVRIYPSSDFPERFEEPGTRWLLRPNQTQPEPIELLKGYYQEGKGLYIVQLAGVGDRNAAEALRGCLLLVESSDRPELEEGEFHVGDLIGLPVYLQATQDLVGTVSNVLFAGNDLLEVQAEGRKETILIPFVEAIVPVVDLEAKRIEITPPPGLI
ncbi:ribosome maturation factor RimM [Alkalinema sp. FACHB-956]|uniref:ribosome maturation factor RimM n=1 Tax=Alkalinema sp. FACHB-956 TaxID=2692768 RepID=UPI0016820244|nr:ribosome maturation factor RimM [Alkalinema sp. FACHB-956]MBD2325415.1 ribosome maturation factor RimM [Alkalinema sp. FACHB-956]